MQQINLDKDIARDLRIAQLEFAETERNHIEAGNELNKQLDRLAKSLEVTVEELVRDFDIDLKNFLAIRRNKKVEPKKPEDKIDDDGSITRKVKKEVS